MSSPKPRIADNGLSDYIFDTRYAQARPGTGRRETFAEAISRVEAMHRAFFREKLERPVHGFVSSTAADRADHALLYAELRDHTVGEMIAGAFAAVRAKQVLPSMRSLHYGGDPILRNQARMFNCAFSPADRVEFFGEYFFLLLSGVGCGFSVQRHHVERLPGVANGARTEPVVPCEHVIESSIEGWALALHALIRARVEGRPIRFHYPPARISSGGDPPRHPDALRRALDGVEVILSGAAGRKLRPIEVYDLCMRVSQAVLEGDGRRAASICLFTADDLEMRQAKTGNWRVRHPERAACTHSAVLSPSQGDEATFRALLDAQREYGEPGLLFTEGAEYGCNPCGEAGLHPVLNGELDGETVRRLRENGYGGNLAGRVRLSGWEMCNLSTINGAAASGPDDFLRACVHAAVIGTLQAAYTTIPFLGPVTRTINETDALLGVSICGFMDNPELLFSPRLLERGARVCRATNQLVAATVGINPAARVTCVKPEGTASLVLNAAPGIHPRPSRRYFRRIRTDRTMPATGEPSSNVPPISARSVIPPLADGSLLFAVEAPPHAIVREDIGAVEFLERVLAVQRHWVLPGESASSRSPGMRHNVSHTCPVRAGEWPEVAAFVWEHRDEFVGVTFLADEAAARYAPKPYEPANTPEERERWRNLRGESAPAADADLAFSGCGDEVCVR